MIRLTYLLFSVVSLADAATITTSASISYVPFGGVTRTELISTANPANVSVSLSDPGGTRSASSIASSTFGNASATSITRSQVSPMEGLHAYIFSEVSASFRDVISFDQPVAALTYRYELSRFRGGVAGVLDSEFVINGVTDVDRSGRFDIPLSSNTVDIRVLVSAASIAVGGPGAQSGDAGSEFITQSITALDSNGNPMAGPLTYSTESGLAHLFTNATHNGSSPIPEPSTYMIIGSGLVALVVGRRYRANRK